MNNKLIVPFIFLLLFIAAMSYCSVKMDELDREHEKAVAKLLKEEMATNFGAQIINFEWVPGHEYERSFYVVKTNKGTFRCEDYGKIFYCY